MYPVSPLVENVFLWFWKSVIDRISPHDALPTSSGIYCAGLTSSTFLASIAILVAGSSSSAIPVTVPREIFLLFFVGRSSTKSARVSRSPNYPFDHKCFEGPRGKWARKAWRDGKSWGDHWAWEIWYVFFTTRLRRKRGTKRAKDRLTPMTVNGSSEIHPYLAQPSSIRLAKIIPISPMAVLPESLQKIQCRLMLVDAGDAGRTEEGKGEETVPFAMKDGEINLLGDPQSVWHIGRKEVRGLRCEWVMSRWDL